MSFNHVVAWIDHAQTHLIRFNADTSSIEVIKTDSHHPHLHVKSAGGAGHAAESARYFDDVAKALAPSREILLVGPGMEKLALMKHLLKHHHEVAERVMSIETVDHPSDGELLKYARKYFVKADMML
ncbi:MULTISPECIES: translational machinery protein [Duganella]|jgi:stalled ribosome rescue protein Dom34|uniref:translational machinery protein n=1 Tax=Duganella TaxID=75654 RepID=UPI0030E939E3